MPDLRRVLRALVDIGSRAKPRIFISYRRRGEGAGYAGRLADRLTQEFGADQCFRDIDDIETGRDFVDEISRAVGSCEVLIVVIGPDWLDARDRDGMRRLDDPRDFVRIEVAAALARGIRVVPVLVGGASVPAPEKLPSTIEGLARRQAHELSDTRWDYDVGQLIGAIEGMGVRRRTKDRSPVRRQWKRAAVLVGSITVAAAAAVPVSRELGWTAAGETYPPSGSQKTRVETTTGDPALLKSMNDVVQGMMETLPARNAQSPAPRGARNVDLVAVPAAQTVPVRPADRSDDAWREEIVDALRRANEAETRAQRTHDLGILSNGFTGEALQLEAYALAALRLSGERSLNRLHDQTIVSIDLGENGRHAVVEAVETWSSMRVDAETDECLYRLAPHRVPQTVHLVRQNGRWIVSSLMTNGEEAEQLPCR